VFFFKYFSTFFISVQCDRLKLTFRFLRTSNPLHNESASLFLI